MATKSFLSLEEETEARRRFPPRLMGPDFSLWLAEKLEARLAKVSGWAETKPVALGSWARGELCPKSDIDVIFLGPEETVQKVVGEIQSRGLKLRSRVPEDPEDWTIGVEAFDVLAILRARAFDSDTEDQLRLQQERIKKRGETFALMLLEAIELERKARASRFDSVANYLEPNLKFGPGGLRDLEQGLAILELFAHRFSDAIHAREQLLAYKRKWLAIRQELHLSGGGDILSGAEQLELAKAFEFTDVRDFMRDFQKGVSIVNFYTRWILAQARVHRPKRRREIKSVGEALRSLEKDPSILNQAWVRERIKVLSPAADWVREFRIGQKEAWFEAVFDSHLIDRWLKDVTRLRGFVQHDHYHRFTADAHLLQAIREVVRAHRKPASLGRLKKWARSLSTHDWQILLWGALFHDLAKGLGGDHSHRGRLLVERELLGLNMSSETVHEIQWLVENHLLLSTAAFRMNVQDPATWQLMHTKGAVGQRLIRLAIFTALDIRATNPDAWNEWKERLLADLLKATESKAAAGFFDLFATAGKNLSAEIAQEIDPPVAAAIPAAKLVADVRRARRAKRDLSPLVLRNRRGETWVRFHRRHDEPGLFLQFVSRLFALGCSIQHSSVRTLPKLGVYDWFHVRTQKRSAQILRQLELIKDWTAVEAPAVHLQHVEVISEPNQDLIISFRGRDQKGVLLATAKALYELGFTIRWAKVITWGNQIDDVFCVQNGPDLESALISLRSRFHVSKAHAPS